MIQKVADAVGEWNRRYLTDFGPEAYPPERSEPVRFPRLRTMDDVRESQSVQNRRFCAVLGQSVLAVACHHRNPDTFNEQFLRMPMFYRVAPQGLQSSKTRIMAALVAQHVIQFGLGLANIALVAAYLFTLRPQAAGQWLWPQTRAHGPSSVMSMESVILVGSVVLLAYSVSFGTPVFVGVLCPRFL